MEFLFLADLHVYILSFLPYQDILQCTSVCRDLRQTYLSSSELQYIVELSGQQLLPVDLPLDSHTPTISECLQLLRDKAHAWFQLNTQPVEHVDVSNKYIMKLTFMSNGHFCLMDDPTLHHNYLRGPTISKIFPILQKPSQRVFDCAWHSNTLSSVPNAQLNDILMDPTQNLLAAAYHVPDGLDVYIDIYLWMEMALTPKLLDLCCLCYQSCMDLRTFSQNLRVGGFGDPVVVADLGLAALDDSVLSDATSGSQISIDHYFLRTSRLLMIVGINLKVYSIEDMSQAPQLLTCFLLPVPVRGTHFLSNNSKDDGAQSRPQPGMQQKMWKSDPTHQIISLNMSPSLHFVISTRIFFEPNFIKGGSTSIPWKHWGPLNTRIFQHCSDVVDSATGSRVLKVEHAIDATDSNDFLEYSLRVMDFSPLAIKYGQGLGWLVIEPSTIDLDGQSLTTSLPYVEVVLSKISSSTDELLFSSIDEDRIYVFHVHDCFVKVIKIWEGV
ncbi:uncharacterized protein F5147DRAFT_782990 [Suillus discolor]|uniref:F-box domain-containing protein n=1 Tax=Suillus discolor TaxID=1912936 RepID=A0A9P7EQC0_9AGAM|nr:uncharacterized protein F5147DRAFT_782990 [Suillus discolor]KAG2083241.1 hypothetical protein F5147DRAFT_782990 [Suillus discolor]